jgi:hypothetical protein
MFGKRKVFKKTLIIGAIFLLMGSIIASSASISLTDSIKKSFVNNKDSELGPLSYETITIEASYSGHIKKTDHTFDSDDYSKSVNNQYILVGHNKKGNGMTSYDKHYKGFIEWDLSDLRDIWDDVDYLVSAEIVFYTSDDDGDNFEDERTISLEIYDIDLQPSETDADDIYNDMFDDINPFKTISASQRYSEKNIDFNTNSIRQNMNYLKDWIAIGLKCGTDIDEGKAGGIAIYNSGSCDDSRIRAMDEQTPVLKITYEEKQKPQDKNYVLLVEGGIGDHLQGCFEKSVKHARNTFVNKLGYDLEDNIKIVWYGVSGNSKSDIRNAIEGWLATHATLYSDCFIYLADHGGDGGKFYIAPPREYITPGELDGWLDTVKCKTMTIVLESCYSGDFTRQLRHEKNRIIITSTDRDSMAIGTSDGYALFSKPFFDKLGESKYVSIGDAWEYADSRVDSIQYLRNKLGSDWALRAWFMQNPKIHDSDQLISEPWGTGNFLANTLPSSTLAKKVTPVP